MVDVGPCLFGFIIDHSQEEASLVHILYLHKNKVFELH